MWIMKTRPFEEMLKEIMKKCSKDFWQPLYVPSCLQWFEGFLPSCFKLCLVPVSSHMANGPLLFPWECKMLGNRFWY